MSTLDQAFIKAYAKDQPAPSSAAPVAIANAAARPQPIARPRMATPTIEQVYRDGTLYRIETPAVVARAATAVPAPHLSRLPPTSPRRHVRRSVLKLIAGNGAAAVSVPPPADPPQRVARKVIIRHISHGQAPQPLGLLARAQPPHVELAPETIAEPPQETIAEPAPFAPLPILPIPPQKAPLNESLDYRAHVAVPEPRQVAALFSNVIVSGSADWKNTSTLMALRLDALDAAGAVAPSKAVAVEIVKPEIEQTVVVPFVAKALDHTDERPTHFRLDPPQAEASRPHLRFVPPPEIAPPEIVLPEAKSPARIIPKEALPEETPLEAPPVATLPEPVPEAADEELTVARVEEEPIAAIAIVTPPELPLEFAAEEESPAAASVDEEPLASDLVPRDESELTATAAKTSKSAAPAAKSAAPLWEVDRFHWPKTCEKLLADESGYLAHAGEKLLAAVQDGLRVLAITGSRRGEGRTTLALCLARTAAAAGVEVAIMDADFARPQIASKIGLEIAFGWQDAALGKIPLSEAAVKSLADNISVLPLEPSVECRSLSLADPRVTATVRAAAATFELLILDLGPLGAGEEIFFPDGEACPLDAAIVVRDLRFATASESEAIGYGLQESGVEAVGIAENFVIEEDIPVAPV